jgi:hypothetical protein
MSLEERAEQIRRMTPNLWADLRMYSTEENGRTQIALPGYGCPCTLQREKGDGWFCYGGWPILDTPIAPGETRRVGFVFLSGKEAAEYLSQNGKFYLWEGRIVGEAIIIPTKDSD